MEPIISIINTVFDFLSDIPFAKGIDAIGNVIVTVIKWISDLAA